MAIRQQSQAQNWSKMKTTIENLVINAGDNVQQLVAAVRGQKQFKELEDSVREKATEDVKAYLKNNKDGYDPSYKGLLDWKGSPITVKHIVTYTWDNLRKSQKPEDKKTDADRELEKNVEEALNLRLFRKQLMDSAKETAEVANANLRAARRNFSDIEKALAKLLPNSGCIHDEIQIAVN